MLGLGIETEGVITLVVSEFDELKNFINFREGKLKLPLIGLSNF